VIIVLSDGSIPFSLSKKLILHIQQPLERFNEQTLKGRIKLSRVRKIFCNSNYTKSFNEKRFRIKTSVIYPPVSLSPKAVKKENIILTVGRYRVQDVVTGTDDYKKFLVMIDAFKKMTDDGLKYWTFVIAASVKVHDKDRFEKLQKTTQGYPISFLINQTNDELWRIYSKAKIYWHAAGYGEDLTKYPQRAEHFGISTVEAMGAGAVPIVINAGGQKEIVTDGENGYLWDTQEELIEKTQMLIKDEAAFLRMSERSMQKARDFSPETFCKEIKALINFK
jgi:glycosyltransferase involved in cell wall biosynthesis